MQSLVEVKMLARLNHPNIVAYKAAWLEPIDKTQRSKHFFHDMNNIVLETRYGFCVLLNLFVIVVSGSY